MLRTLIAVALILGLAGCAKPRTSIPKAFAACKAKAFGPNEEGMADCMDAYGYEIRSGECSLLEDPELAVGCYRRKYP